MADSVVKVNIVGDASDLKRATADADESLGKLSGSFSRIKDVALGVLSADAVQNLGQGLMNASKAAAQDEAAQASLARTLQNVTGATKQQVKGVEDFISKTQNATGVLDDELRPAFDTLVRGTKDVGEAQRLMSLAMDISAGTGKSLADVTDGLSKAANGNFKSLKALNPALNDLIKDGASTEEVFAALGQTFEGQAATAAATTAGQMAILQAHMADLQELVGGVVNVVILTMVGILTNDLIPAIQAVVGWLSDHHEVLAGVAAVVVGAMVPALAAWVVATYAEVTAQLALAAAFIAANIEIIAIIAVIAALVAAVVYAYEHWEFFRVAVDAVAHFLTDVLWPALQTIVSFIVDEVIPVIVDVIEWHVRFAQKVAEVASLIAGYIFDIVRFFIGLATGIAGVIADIGSTLAGWVLDVWHFGGMVLEFVSEIPGKIAGWLEGLGEILMAPFRAAFDWIRSAWDNSIGSIYDKIKSIGGTIGGIVGSIPGFAGGGYPTGLAMVGENGPELVDFGNSGARVFSTQDTAGMLGGSGRAVGGVNIYLTVNGASSPSATADAVARTLMSNQIRVALRGAA